MRIDRERVVATVVRHATKYTTRSQSAKFFLVDAMSEIAQSGDSRPFVKAGVWRGGSAIMGKMIVKLFGIISGPPLVVFRDC